MPTYRETYPDSLTSGHGLIYDLGKLSTVPWVVLADDVMQDVERAYNIRSGFKTLIDSFTIPEPTYRAKLLAAMYAEKWTRLWTIYNMEYDPLHAYKVDEKGHKTIGHDSTNVDKFGKTLTKSDSDNGTITSSVNGTNTHSIEEESSYGKTRTESSTDSGTVKNSKEETNKTVREEENSYGKTVIESITDNGTVNREGTVGNDSNDSVYGFNSSEAVPSNFTTSLDTSSSIETRNGSVDKNVTDGGKDTRTQSDDETRNLENTETRDLSGQISENFGGKDTRIHNDEESSQLDTSETRTSSREGSEVYGGQDEKSVTETGDEDWEISKAGNIGYTTPQKLLREEFDLWRTPFFSIVFEDIDSFITIGVY